MTRITQKKVCCGCHACLTICPLDCIEMVADSEGFLYPQRSEQLCTDCGICETVCTMLHTPRQGESPRAFAAWNREEAIRSESSSGGVFSALMRLTLQQNGVVFGAAFNESMTLSHQVAQNEAEGRKFRGSKYLQSVIGTAFFEAKEYLRQGRRVLFSGTPCQIAGLNAYLGKNDDNLLTCDLICHGVPSPKIFAAYQAALERRHGGKVQEVSFRNKTHGWNLFSMSLSFDNGATYRKILTEDSFMLGFLRNIYLRPSCHACCFSRLPRMADISLGDFWGVADHHPEWDDDCGTSLILVQTEKGQAALDACRDSLVVHEADLAVAIRSNPCICGSVAASKNRADFFIDLDRLPFEKVMRKYMLPPSCWRKAINLGRRAVGYGYNFLRLLQS